MSQPWKSIGEKEELLIMLARRMKETISTNSPYLLSTAQREYQLSTTELERLLWLFSSIEWWPEQKHCSNL